MTLSTLYTNLPYDELKSKLSYMVEFVFKVGDKTFIRSSNNGAAYWRKKTKRAIGFSKA